MRAITAVLAAALLMVIGASAAPTANAVRAIEDAVTTVLSQPERSAPVQGPNPAENPTATTVGSTIYQPPTPEPVSEPDPFFDVEPDPCIEAHEDDWDALEQCWFDEVEDLPVPSIEEQSAGCAVQTGASVGCKEKIRYGIVD